MCFEEFDWKEKNNVTWYIIGLLTYKFVLETMNACMSGIILNRLADEHSSPGLVWTGLVGLNLCTQCIGSLMVGPLIKKNHSARVLALSMLGFAVTMLFVPILELITGGTVPAIANGGSKLPQHWGDWTPYLLFVIFPIAGIFNGMVDLMRKVIPAHIVGGNPIKLKQMDSTVHVFYEITGTAGAIASVYWISYFGWGYAVSFLPGGFLIAFFCFLRIVPRNPRDEYLYDELDGTEVVSSACVSAWTCDCDLRAYLSSFVHSVGFGARLIVSRRSLIWLVPAYTIPLIMHRYLESTIFSFYSKSVFNNTDYQMILTGGSNFGELIGALSVLFLARVIQTPIPFLRVDALLVLLIWVLPFWPSDVSNAQQHAWQLAPIMALISSGWAAGDVSLAAYIQTQLADTEDTNEHTSPLGAVMSFLYVLFLVGFFFLNLGMGYVRDDYIHQGKSIQELFIYTAGVFLSACGFIVFISTFIPKGAFACNPKESDSMLDDPAEDELISLTKIPRYDTH